ncbi:MAG: VanZ family protein [Lachnospiraceae bacterium]|nr:VanZ family protein [Lachnospiraceae bacterium]
MKKEKGKKKNAASVSEQKTNFLAWVLFLGYLCLLFYLLFFSEKYGRTDVAEEYRYNLTLFKEIKRFWLNWKTIGIKEVVINLFGNVAAFVPFGFLLPMICRRGRKLFCCTVMTALFSLSVEAVQLLSKVGAFDVDDILLNTIGGLLGFIGYEILFGFRERKGKNSSK